MATPDWLQEQLFERRIVFLTGRLDDVLAGQLAAQIMALDASSDAPIDLFIDSGEGKLEAAFVLIDVLDAARTAVRAHCRGQVSGPAVGVAAAASHCSAAPHTVFRLTAPVETVTGTADEVGERSAQLRQLLWRFQARLANATGRPAEDIADDVRRGRHLDARQALDYGLIDAIGP
jgi:ATP-dependent Clp protease, protease subunit